jgi:hypothetical protein
MYISLWWISRSRRCTVQMGAIADQFTKLFELEKSDRKTLVFWGNRVRDLPPFWDASGRCIVSIELLCFNKLNYKVSCPIVAMQLISDRVMAWQHTAIICWRTLTTVCFYWIILNSMLLDFAATLLFSRAHIGPSLQN